METNGHINFWADLEKGVSRSLSLPFLYIVADRNTQVQQPTPTPERRRGGNAEYEADKRREEEKWDSQLTMYLGRPAKELKPWYTSEDLVSGEDRKKTEEQKMEAA
jgi:hypothetical protein